MNEEDKFIAQASEQHIVCDTDLGEVPAILSAPRGDMLVRVFGSGRISGQ